MKLSGIQKLTLIDFPGRVAATVFTPGCNFRCPFCHNSSLVVGELNPTFTIAPAPTFPEYPLDEFFAFLDKRTKLLDGVCITGGEPLLQSGIDEFCREIRARGFAVKIDTNGSLPGRLGELIDAYLIDYVAMDLKNTRERYDETAGTRGIVPAIEASMTALQESGVAHEYRTTTAQELHSAGDLEEIARWIDASDPQATWYLQNYLDSDEVLYKQAAGTGIPSLTPWPHDKLASLCEQLQAIHPATNIRGE